MEIFIDICCAWFKYFVLILVTGLVITLIKATLKIFLGDKKEKKLLT